MAMSRTMRSRSVVVLLRERCFQSRGIDRDNRVLSHGVSVGVCAWIGNSFGEVTIDEPSTVSQYLSQLAERVKVCAAKSGGRGFRTLDRLHAALQGGR